MKRCLLLLLAMHCMAQDVTVTVKGTGSRGEVKSTTILYKKSIVTYSIGNAVIDGAGKADINISINSRTGQLPASLQFELAYTPADVTDIIFVEGAASLAATKTIQCSKVAEGKYRCLISGMNQTGIADGVIATAKVQTSLTSAATSTLAVLGTVSASKNGNAISSEVPSPNGTVDMPALVAQVSCAQADIWAEATVTCTAAINKPAPSGGLSVILVSSDALVSLPSTAVIPAGSTSVQFTASGN